ncbi:MAG: hypothetical protein ACTSV7_05425 [Candidatus Baldrarchaeia archaeon]
MKCSVELPIENLNLSDQFDYDFVIASTYVEHLEYREWYQAATERFMILDNGAFETGEAMADDRYIDLAKKLMPNVLVIPDVYKKPKETLDRFSAFMNKWDHVEGVGDINLMGVIQAGGSVDMAHAMGILYDSYGVEWVGVPYACELDRYQLILTHPEWENVHILGLPVLPEVLGLNLLENVKTIDSSLPVKATRERKKVDDCLYAETYVKPDDRTLDVVLLEANLSAFRTVCQG